MCTFTNSLAFSGGRAWWAEWGLHGKRIYGAARAAKGKAGYSEPATPGTWDFRGRVYLSHSGKWCAFGGAER